MDSNESSNRAGVVGRELSIEILVGLSSRPIGRSKQTKNGKLLFRTIKKFFTW